MTKYNNTEIGKVRADLCDTAELLSGEGVPDIITIEREHYSNWCTTISAMLLQLTDKNRQLYKANRELRSMIKD